MLIERKKKKEKFQEKKKLTTTTAAASALAADLEAATATAITRNHISEKRKLIFCLREDS